MTPNLPHPPVVARASAGPYPSERPSHPAAPREAAPGRTPVLAVLVAGLLFGGCGTAGAQEAARAPNGAQEPLAALPAQTVDQTGVEAPPGSDLWARARLITTYSLNEHLNPFDITVDVEGDTVTLSGTLDSPVQRELAVRLARDLTGIDTVVDRLQVMPPPGEAVSPPNPLYRAVDEANTTARVKLQLLWREPVNGLLVEVTTSGDKVILTGPVDSAEAKQRAEEIAWRTTGVAAVENRLRVDPGADVGDRAGAVMTSATEAISDAWLTARVAASLRFDRTVDAERIDVSTQEGVVSLAGQVPTLAHKRKAETVAAALDGVNRVENLLAVDDTDA